MALPSGTVTLLLADVEGSVRLWEADREAMRAAMKALEELATEAIDAHGGARPLEQGEGDNLVAAFERASDAVACAVAIVRGVEGEDWPGDVRPRLRVGIHTGEVELRDQDRYEGGTVNRCARLRDSGHGGQILLSRTTHDLVADRMPEGAALSGLGAHRLRDMARPEDVYQICHPGLPDTFPPLRSSSSPPNNLPRQLTSFIGREAETAALREILTEARLVTLTGAGGCGKTRLGVHVAMDLLDDYPDGAWWVDLARLSDPALVPAALASTLGVKEAPARTVGEQTRTHLASRRTLIVLDNCEHLIHACAELASELLQACPQVSILATSREPLGVVGEVAWRVPSLALPDDQDTVGVESLTQCEAVRLFIDRATRVRPNFQVTNDNAPSVAEICVRLEGIPLAIELAAARTRMMTPQQIVAGLSDRFRLLTGSHRGVLPRHQTLEASVEWSYQLLGSDGRTMLARLAVFRGSFTLDAAEDVCSGDGLERLDVLELLSDLVDRSLVQVDEEGHTARYHLLETIRQYAGDRLRTAGDEGDVRARHLDYYASLAEEAEPELQGPGQKAWLERLDLEHGNLRAAMDHGQQSGRVEGVLRIAAGIWPYWMMRGHITEAYQRVKAALEGGDAAPQVRARALVGACQVGIMAYSPPWAREFAEEAVALGREVGDQHVVGRALASLGQALGFRDPASAGSVVDEAIEICASTGDAWFLASAWFVHFQTHLSVGALVPAGRSLDEAVSVNRAAGISYALGANLSCLGQTLTFQGALACAEATYGEALAIARDLRDQIWEDWCLAGLAWIAAWRGEYDAAAMTLDEVVSRTRAAGSLFLFDYLLYDAHLLFARGELEAAEERADETVGILREIDMSFGFAAPAWRVKVDALRLRGDLAGAAGALEEALSAANPTRGVWRGFPLESKGRLLRAQGAIEKAEEAHHDALRALIEGGGYAYVPDTLESLAALAVIAESNEEAARLFGAAEAQRERMGTVRFAVEQEGHEADVASAREGLPDDDFERAWEEGRAMALDEAVAYAARGRGERKRPSSGWASLTPTETQVVKLVAEGLTNPEVAERMFVARATVKAHLSNIFRKLDVTTRSELAAEATRRAASPDSR